MELNIFNIQLLKEIDPTFGISLEDIFNGYVKIFREYFLERVNIVFVDIKYITELNGKYRGFSIPTDVLSFNISDERKSGEVYICPEYIYKTFKKDKFEEEVLRLIIHGTLHILGFNHLESMEKNNQEEFFLLQERLLVKYKKYVSSNRAG
ncbi:rRNA maturation RNase YbeY [Candidatus Dojkabacteria bacterium]|uniref:Endoribonuclease YbeY n=1 Tax=Candidatus Dojkabacteria bacterium TaxID=2099670 RepID=A0A847VDH3_9BACT|nr:rRNA maturation RNase YbeY [Candidatus Dojkabacteria bacterium]